VVAVDFELEEADAHFYLWRRTALLNHIKQYSLQ